MSAWHVLEIYAWLKGLKDERTILADTIEFARMELINSGMLREGASAAPCRIRLPMSTKSYEAKTFESGGWANLYGANPLSESTETEFLSCLHGELNLKFAMNLEESPVVDRQAGSPDSPKRYIVVGSSHAGRLCGELSQMGHKVIDVIWPGWRVMPSTVLSMKELLEKRIKEAGGCKHNDIYVFQLWDNTLHAAWAEELATIPHTKDALGKYHVQGDAIIVQASTQTEIFKMVLPILKVAKSFNTVLVGPLPRYLYASCCRDKDHVTTLRKDDYRSKMRADCDMARQKLKDSAWFSGLEKAKAINLGRSLRDFCDKEGMDERLLWIEDPVHPTLEGYRAIAEDIVRVASTIAGPEDRKKRLSEGLPYNVSKRGRGSQDDRGTLLHGGQERERAPGPSFSKYARGQRGLRGQRGHRGHRGPAHHGIGRESKWPIKRSFYGDGKKSY